MGKGPLVLNESVDCYELFDTLVFPDLTFDLRIQRHPVASDNRGGGGEERETLLQGMKWIEFK